MLPSGAWPPNPLQTGAGASSGLTRYARPCGVDLRSIHLRFAPSPPKVPAAGFAPASIRLEGGGLSFSATRRKWTSRRDSHPQHSVRSAA